MKAEDEKIELLLSQWKTCVEMANSVSQRRDAMNKIFITLNLAIVTTVSVTWDLKMFFILVVGMATCVIWLLFIRNYRELNTEKFKVINAIEQRLPVKPFNEEWKGLKANQKYMDGTRLEKVLPCVFIAIYVVATVLIFILK